MGDLISIIVPVYNKEKFLDKCILSLVNQTYRNIEIIIINDGSSDKSEEICRKYAENDSRILFFPQDNHGVSYTRNRGISIATGKWIMFVDADDYLDLDVCKRAVEEINTSKFDVLFWGALNIEDLNNSSAIMFSGCDRTWEKSEFINLIRTMVYSEYDSCKSNFTLWGPCCKIIRKEILCGVSFPENIDYGEDTCFIAQVLKKADAVKYINEVLYYRVVDCHSLSYEMSKDIVKRRVEFLKWILAFWDNDISYDEMRIMITRAYWSFMAFFRCKGMNIFDEKKVVRQAFKELHIRRKSIFSLEPKTIFVLLIYVHHLEKQYNYLNNLRKKMAKKVGK